MPTSYPPVLNELIDSYFSLASKHSFDEEIHASGACWEAAAGFAQVAARFGVDAEWVEFNVDTHPVYATRSILGGYSYHAVTVLDFCGEQVSVDWTAAQYGFNDFPLVSAWDENGDLDVSDRSTEPIDINGTRLESSWWAEAVEKIRAAASRGRTVLA